MSTKPDTPLLDKVNSPVDLRMLPKEQLQQLSDELRTEIINAASVSGGHFGAGLGVVELTVALHYVFNTPDDRLIWDVGHQAYPHKIITGRRDGIRSIRQPGGLSLSPNAGKANMTRLVQGTPARRSVRHWVWPWPTNCRTSLVVRLLS